MFTDEYFVVGGYATDASAWKQTRLHHNDTYSYELYPSKGEQFLSLDMLKSMPANVVEVILKAEHLNEATFEALPAHLSRMCIDVWYNSRPLNFDAKCFQKFTNLKYLEIFRNADLVPDDEHDRYRLNTDNKNIVFMNDEDFDYLPRTLTELHLYCQTAISPRVFNKLPKSLKVLAAWSIRSVNVSDVLELPQPMQTISFPFCDEIGENVPTADGGVHPVVQQLKTDKHAFAGDVDV